MARSEIVRIITFRTRLMRKQCAMAFVLLLLLGSTLSLTAAASTQSPCPTAGKTVIVVAEHSNPKTAAVGTTAVTS
jgi:hypothetical protein